MAESFTPQVEGTGVKATIQRFGGYLAGMVMPNIGAFIAWGLITAAFIPTGWIPNARFAALVGPMILYLLPLLIGYTGGKMVHAQRGAVVGAIATMGVILGGVYTHVVVTNGVAATVHDQIPMFLGAMIVGPLAAFILKEFDKRVMDRVKAGFEMLVGNYAIGIIGGVMALLGVWVFGPIVTHLTEWLGSGVNTMVRHHLTPLAAIVIEPAKVLFMNNAINHGILTPLGTIATQAHGKSILFMLESNPGPGLGLLMAYWFFGPRELRPTAPGAIIIHFFGGIHEIYFPYVLMKPKLILATIAGGASGIAVFSATGVGLQAPPSPGSIISYLQNTPSGNYVGVLLGVAVAAAVSLFVAAALMGFGRGSDVSDSEALTDAQDRNREAKAASKVGVPTAAL